MTEPPSVPGSGEDEGGTYRAQRYPRSGNLPPGMYFQDHALQHQGDADPFVEWTTGGDYERPANTANPASHAGPTDTIGLERSHSQPPQQSSPPPNNDLLRRGARNYAETPDASYREQHHVPLLPYNTQPPPQTDFSANSPHMQRQPFYTRSTPQPVQPSGSKYEPYRSRFGTPGDASRHRKEATRFNRKPYRPPDTDQTIYEVERDRLYHVERIYTAMTRGDSARDNKNSIAMKRWVHGAYYKSDLVEAYAHKVLDCLLLQAKEGFRGWVHNDYVADDRKGEDEDRDVTCEERLESILRALQEEKTICEDVMNSACQIRMFVNAPKAYANRKYQNRVGNSKRGRPKDSDANETPAKARKLNPKPVTRARRAGSNLLTTASPLPRLHSQTPELSPRQRPQALLSAPPVYAVSPDMTGVPRPAPIQLASYAQHRLHAISPPPRGLSPGPRVATMPPQQYAPVMSPPALSHGYHSAPASPEDEKLVHDPEAEPWPQMQQYGSSLYPVDEPLFNEGWSMPNGQQGQVYTGAQANIFAQHPDLAEVALSPKQQVTREAGGDFSAFWRTQQGVQQLPYPHSSDYHEGYAGSGAQ